MIVASIVLGFALNLWSLMLNRGADTAWAADGDEIDHDWRVDPTRSYFTRIVSALAGIPSFVLLAIAGGFSVGWWAGMLVPAGWIAAFFINLLLLGGSRERVAHRMRSVRPWVAIATICLALGTFAMA